MTISTLDARGLDTLMIDIEKVVIDPNQVVTEMNVHSAAAIAYGKIMSELASATGGTYFHDNNDLKGGLAFLTKAPEYLYLLEFSPRNVKPDDTYHSLRVNVDTKGLTIRARAGYFAEKPANVNQADTSR